MIEVNAMNIEYLESENRIAGRGIFPERVEAEVMAGDGCAGNISGILGGFSTSGLSVSMFALAVSMLGSVVSISSFSVLSYI